MKYLIPFFLSAVMACNTSTSGTAVAFLWNEEPTAESSKIMVMSELSEDSLREEVRTNIEAIGFIVDDMGEEMLVTEPKDIPESSMVMVVEFNNNAVLISAKEGTAEDIDDLEPVIRGEGEASYAWETMELLANAIESTSRRYN